MDTFSLAIFTLTDSLLTLKDKIYLTFHNFLHFVHIFLG